MVQQFLPETCHADRQYMPSKTDRYVVMYHAATPFLPDLGLNCDPTWNTIVNVGNDFECFSNCLKNQLALYFFRDSLSQLIVIY